MFPSVNYTFQNKPLNGQRLPYEREQPLLEKALLLASHFILIIKAPHTSLSRCLSLHAHLFTFSQCHAHMPCVSFVFHFPTDTALQLQYAYAFNLYYKLPMWSTLQHISASRRSSAVVRASHVSGAWHSTAHNNRLLFTTQLGWQARICSDARHQRRQQSLHLWGHALVGAKHHIHEQPDRII